MRTTPSSGFATTRGKTRVCVQSQAVHTHSSALRSLSKQETVWCFSAECGHGGAAHPADQYPNGNSRTHVYLFGEDTGRFKVQADEKVPGKTNVSIFPVSGAGAVWSVETVQPDGSIAVTSHHDNPQPAEKPGKRKQTGKGRAKNKKARASK